jgi:hypothetical protein
MATSWRRRDAVDGVELAPPRDAIDAAYIMGRAPV